MRLILNWGWVERAQTCPIRDDLNQQTFNMLAYNQQGQPKSDRANLAAGMVVARNRQLDLLIATQVNQYSITPMQTNYNLLWRLIQSGIDVGNLIARAREVNPHITSDAVLKIYDALNQNSLDVMTNIGHAALLDIRGEAITPERIDLQSKQRPIYPLSAQRPDQAAGRRDESAHPLLRRHSKSSSAEILLDGANSRTNDTEKPDIATAIKLVEHGALKQFESITKEDIVAIRDALPRIEQELVSPLAKRQTTLGQDQESKKPLIKLAEAQTPTPNSERADSLKP